MRGRQFIMKDLYTFDLDDKHARETYDIVCNSYQNIFKTIGINALKGKYITLFITPNIMLL